MSAALRYASFMFEKKMKGRKKAKGRGLVSTIR